MIDLFRADKAGVLVDEDGRVVPGVVCDRCRYDLRGQAFAGHCPECGDAIGPMLRAMVTRDIRQPYYAIAIVGSTAAACVFLAVAYLYEYLTNNFQPPRIEWFDVLRKTMAATFFSAIVSLVPCIVGEIKNNARLSALGLGLTIGFVFYTIVYLALTFMAGTT